MSWEEIDKVLVLFAKRKGSKYEGVWYGEYWDGLIKGPAEAYYKCLICGEKIASYPIANLQVVRPLMDKAAKEHGMQHMKDSNLLPFL